MLQACCKVWVVNTLEKIKDFGSDLWYRYGMNSSRETLVSLGGDLYFPGSDKVHRELVDEVERSIVERNLAIVEKFLASAVTTILGLGAYEKALRDELVPDVLSGAGSALHIPGEFVANLPNETLFWGLLVASVIGLNRWGRERYWQRQVETRVDRVKDYVYLHQS